MYLIKKMPIAAAVLGLMIVCSQSAFKSLNKTTDILYGKDPGGVWINLSTIPEDATFPYQSNSYRCVTDANSSCTVLSPTQPADNTDVAGARKGRFMYTP